MLAAPSLGKRPIKGANFEIIKALKSLPSHEYVKGFLPKGTVLKADWLLSCLQACMCALFSLEILQAGAVKGLMLGSVEDVAAA